MKDETQNSMLNTIISVAPTLLQVFGFFALELSDRLHLDKLFEKSEQLVFVNFLSLFISILFIALYSYWKPNSWAIESKKDANGNYMPQDPEQKKTFDFQKISLFVAIVSLIVLLGIMCLDKQTWKWNYDLFLFLQWISYILLFSSISFAIFIWLQHSSITKGYAKKRESFVMGVLERLRETGWLSPTKVLRVDQNKHELIIKKDEGKYLKVKTSFDGIIESVEESESIPA